MRRSWLLLMLLLAACSSGLPQVPGQLRLGYDGRGGLNLTVPASTVWSLSTGELQVSPPQGIGPAAIGFTAPADSLPDQPQVVYQLAWGGDLSGELTVTWPLVRVEGSVNEAATSAGVQATAKAAAIPAAFLPEPASAAAPQRVLVRYKDPAFAPQSSRAAGSNRVRIIETTNPRELLERLRSDPNVVWAEPDGVVHALGEPSDQYYPLEWHLRKTGARWAYLANLSAPVTVAVIDTGVRYDHPDLAGRLWNPGEGAYDFVEGDTDPTDPGDSHNPAMGSHGTHVTGIVTAKSGLNSLPPQCYDGQGNPVCSLSGVVGLAWPANVKVLPLRVLDENGNGSFSTVAAAIRYAAGLSVQWSNQTLTNPHPAQVINLSLGATSSSSAICDAVADARAAGSLVVAAAGNSGSSAYYYPASCPGAIAVAATDNSPGNPQPTWYSEHNDRVSISAPGGDTRQDADNDGYPDGVLSTTWNFQTNTPNYAFYMGTSQASPQVAAALALLIASGNTPQEAWDRLKSTSTDLGEPGYDEYYGFGFINLPAALALTLPPGPYRVHFSGPAERWLQTDADGRFGTYLPSGRYQLIACRDDSQNGFCDLGEPSMTEALGIPPKPLLLLPTMTVSMP